MHAKAYSSQILPSAPYVERATLKQGPAAWASLCGYWISSSNSLRPWACCTDSMLPDESGRLAKGATSAPPLLRAAWRGARDIAGCLRRAASFASDAAAACRTADMASSSRSSSDRVTDAVPESVTDDAQPIL
eukprot:CAMPEP_0178443378 /NCGR_PEP_ID=MMETSP0689_2-20121128/38860_1 /TAXON_ID=160604 /ORGANISM="Amphidinium massartii, Strain CS-259" /LENGTH=132 /DNA_ID=CAMNT_0020067375 /DNA_START=156 /DNA_END=553 /DNA_ORIENTATION=+